jgi:hypothetical protein
MGFYCKIAKCHCTQTRRDASRLRGKRHISCISPGIDCVPEGVEYFSFQKMGEKRSFGDLASRVSLFLQAGDRWTGPGDTHLH